MEILPLAEQGSRQLAILLDRMQFNSARKCLEEYIQKITWMHDRKQMGNAKLCDLILPANGGEWEWELIEKLEELGIRYVSQVFGKSWEQLKNLGLEDPEVSWLQFHTDMLATRVAGTRRGQFNE